VRRWIRGSGAAALIAGSFVTFGIGTPWFSAASASATASQQVHSGAEHRGHCVQYQPYFPVGGQGAFQYLTTTEIGGIDASGCDSWVYELLVRSFPEGFFAGQGFQAGKVAYQYGTLETTAIKVGKQLIAVTNPTAKWLAAYSGYDTCARQDSGENGSRLVCTAPAVSKRPDRWLFYIPLIAILALMILFMIHFMRPAGPIRRKRRFHKHHHELAVATDSYSPPDLLPAEAKRLHRRLRRLEKATVSELSESQHQWFLNHLAHGRHGMALESLARWTAEAHLPVPDHVREEFEWLATSLSIRNEILPVIDRQVANEGAVILHPHVADDTGGGVDVPVGAFRQLVAEALDSLPEAFGRAMNNLAVTVQEEAEGRDLFGLYIGVPLTRRRYREWTVHPDRIIIYRKTICDHCRSTEEVKAQVYATVVHEIAHHFGISDPRLRELGW
jgi:predicted Zn-dependent protease with MMP-like domain